MKKSKRLTPIIIFFIIFISTIYYSFPGYAADNTVIITTNPNGITYKKELSLDVNIEFYNVECSENLYFSYHILDPTTGEFIQFENRREPLILNDSNKATLNLYLDVNNFMSNYKSIKIVFDIVDVTNSFWFSTNPTIILESNSLEFQDKPIANIQHNIQKRSSIFIFNIIFCVISICVYFKTRRFFKF